MPGPDNRSDAFEFAVENLISTLGRLRSTYPTQYLAILNKALLEFSLDCAAGDEKQKQILAINVAAVAKVIAPRLDFGPHVDHALKLSRTKR